MKKEKNKYNETKDFLHQEIEKAVAEREKEIVGKVLKIINDNDPQTDNKVSPKYWGAILRKNILSLLTKEI